MKYFQNHRPVEHALYCRLSLARKRTGYGNFLANRSVNYLIHTPNRLFHALLMAICMALAVLASGRLAAESSAANEAGTEGSPAQAGPNWLAPGTDQWASRELGDLRNDYRQARTALEQREYKRFRQLRAGLDNYPLAGYLDYRFLLRNPQQLDAAALADFDNRHGNARLTRYLKRKWLQTLASERDWDALVEHYEPELANTRLHCAYLRGRLQQDTGLLPSLLPEIELLWLSPSSLPKDCDPLFKRMINGPGVSPTAGWQRFLLSYGAREIQLAKYLVRYLDKGTREQAEQLLALYRKPAGVPENWSRLRETRELLPAGFTPGETDIRSLVDAALLQLLKRLARADSDAAVAMARQMGEDPLAPALKRYLLTRAALASYRDVPGLYQTLQITNDGQAYSWLLRAHIAAADWPALERALAELPADIADEERWQYWRLRAAQLQAPLDEGQLQAMNALAGKANFYGFMSAALLQRDYTFAPEFGLTTEPDTEAFLQRPALQRAIEHWLHDEPNSAHAEWHVATRQLSAQQQLAAGYLARNLGWQNPAINSAIAAGAWQHYPLRFPNIYRDDFARAALQHALPLSWIYATARQESALATHAKSSAGALGLMQMLPTTAREVAAANNVEHETQQLFEAAHSIRLASYYLAELHERFGQRALASAAYNAGPHRVQRWLEDLETALPADAWIETIRFNETRQYVQNVLSFSLIYQLLYGEGTALANDLQRPAALLRDGEQIVKPLADDD